METDISLIEIGGEDDSLLLQFTKEECNNNNNNNPHLDLDINHSSVDFSCSPLQTFRSKRSADPSQIHSTNFTKNNVESEKPSCSSPIEANNKENLNKNNLGMKSSNDEPQLIKRRKKGGGYNLRKSLAWNKAFSTEEGVLNPLELSMLSGSLSKFRGEFLSGIHEEGNESDLLALEENSLNGLPERSLNKDQKAPRRVHVAKAVNRNVSQGGGYPRPLGSSSQKRLPNTNTANVRVKDSKIPKLPVSKQESSSVSKRTKCNQNIPSAVSVDKNRGLKGSTINSKTASNSTSLSAKSFVLRSRKNMASSSSVTNISTNPRPPKASKGTSTSLKVNPNPVLRADIHAPTGDSGSSKSDFSLSQNARNVGANIVHAKFQPTKPSGLRMPSPSLRLFDQAKASSSPNIQSLRNTQSSNCRESSVSNLRKLSSSNHVDELKSLHAPVVAGRLTKVGNDDHCVGRQYGEHAELRNPCPDEVEKIQPKENHRPQMNNKILVEESGSFEESSKDYDIENSTVDPESRDSSGSKMENSDVLFLVSSVMQVKASDCRNDNKINIPRVKDSQFESFDGKLLVENHDLFSAQFRDGIINCNQRCLRLGDDADEQAEPTKTCPEKNNSILVETSRSFEESPYSNDLGKTTVNPESRDSSGSEMGSSDDLRPVISEIQVNESGAGVDTQFESLNKNSSIENHDLISDTLFIDATDNGNPHSFSTVCDHIDDQTGEKAEPMKPCLDEIEHSLRKEDHEQQMNDNTLLEQSKSSGESPKDCGNLLIKQERFSEESGKNNDLENVTNNSSESGGSESKSFHNLSQIKTAMQMIDGTEITINQPIVEDVLLESLDINPSVENHDSINDTLFGHAINNTDLFTLGSETSVRSSKDQATGSSTNILGLSVRTRSTESVLGRMGNDGLNNMSFDETETHLSEDSKIPDGLQNGVFPSEDTDSTINRRSLDDSKQDSLAMAYKLNATPFSDEWLAALEAAGEDILTMKTGSVQNSPPEKSLPEPGPWSPVKRKSNQEIGPFDCTKYTNLPPPNH